MSRYIKAEDVANAIYHHFPSVRTMADARGVIEEAPSIDIPQWTPCSERLPSECDEFLITWTASVTNGPLLAFAEYEPDAFLVSGGKWYLEDDMREFKDVDVIAWMPLPKPYGERKESE